MKRILREMLVLFMLKILSIAHFWTKNHIYKTKFGLAKGLKRKGGLGFIPQIVKLTKEERFLKNLNLVAQNVYDVGGADGIFTIFFARAVGEKGKVVTFEPNPELYEKIVENVKLNKFDNVNFHQLALGKESKKTTLAFPSLRPGTGSIHERVKIKLESRGAKIIEVEVDSLDNQIAMCHLPKPDFVKIDVQGFDFDVLVGMSNTIKKYMPKLMVEIHSMKDENWRITNLLKVVKMLVAKEYSIYHVESQQMITYVNATKIVEDGDHLYCF